MELDEMKLAWRTLEHRLERQHALNVKIFRDDRLEKMRSGLRPLVWGQAVQLVFGLLLGGLGGAFWVTHVHVMHLLICGLLVHAYGVLLIVFAARVLYLVQCLDYAAPVLAIQRQLADLRSWRVRVEAPVNAVLGCLVWIPVSWMTLAWYDIDPWSPKFMPWAISSGLAGFVAVVLVVWLMRRAGMGRKIEDSSVGRGVQSAEMALAEIVLFERD